MTLSPVNPRRPPGITPDARVADRLAALERRIRSLEAFYSGGATAQVPVVLTLPPAGRKGRVLILDSDDRLYRDTGAAWVPVG